MSGNIQCTFCALGLLILGGRNYINLAFQTLRQRKIRKVPKDHIASKWESQDSNPEPGCKAHSLNSDTELPPIVSRWIK